jgi:hypothetical protein
MCHLLSTILLLWADLFSSVVIDELEAKFPTADVGIAFFYFEKAKQELQSVDQVLSSILRQFAGKKSEGDFTPDLVSTYHSCRSQGKRPDSERLLAIITSFRSKYSSMYVILDALDECRDQSTITEIILQLSAASIRVLTTSRLPDTEVGPFEQATTIEIIADMDDIKNYLTKRLSKERWSSKFKNKVVASLGVSAKGL